MGDVNLLLVLFSLGVTWLAVLGLPKWLLTSSNRTCMWELRDDVFDHWRQGRISTDSLDYLLGQIDTAIVAARYLTPFNIWMWERAMQRFTPAELRRTAKFRPEMPQNVSPDERAVLREKLGRLNLLLARQLFTGSWAGIFMLAWLLARSRWSDAVSMKRLRGKDSTDGRTRMPLRNPDDLFVQVEDYWDASRRRTRSSIENDAAVDLGPVSHEITSSPNDDSDPPDAGPAEASPLPSARKADKSGETTSSPARDSNRMENGPDGAVPSSEHADPDTDLDFEGDAVGILLIGAHVMEVAKESPQGRHAARASDYAATAAEHVERFDLVGAGTREFH